MAESRDRTDLDRADRSNRFEYTRDDRLPSSWRRDFDRSDVPDHSRRVQVSERAGFVDQMAKLALYGVGVWAAGKLFSRSGFGTDLLHNIGQFGRNLNSITRNTILHVARADRSGRGYIIRKPTPNSVVTALKNLEAEKESMLGQVSMIDDIADSLAVIRQHQSRKGTVNHLPTNLREAMVDRFKNPSRRAPVIGRLGSDRPSGYGNLTIGDVVSDQRYRGLVSQQQYQILEQGVESGLVSHRTRMGRGLTRAPDGSFRDTRWTNPWKLAQSAIDTLSYLQIPIINFPIGKFFETPLMLARHGFRKSRGVSTIRPGTKFGGVGPKGEAANLVHGGWIVDGNLMAITDAGDVKTIASNIRSFSVANRGLARVAGAQYGLYQEPTAMLTRGTLRENISQVIGIGPEYKTERSAFSGLVLDPVRRIFRGRVKTKSMVPEAKRLTFGERVVAEAGRVNLGQVPLSAAERRKLPGRTKFWDRTKALFGKGDYYEYVDDAAPGGKIRGIADADPGIGFAGQANVHYKGGWGSLQLAANWIATRPSELMSWTFGVGYRPGAGKYGFAKSGARLFGAAAIAGAGLETVKYADYLLEDNVGVSPFKTAAWGWTRARLGLKWIQDHLGITQTARYMEDLAPRSVSSAGSGLLRASLPALGAVTSGKRGFAVGLAGAVLTGGLPDFVFTPEHTLKSYADLNAEYEGTKRVPVRANRWWEFNTDEYTGGKIKYFKQSWYSELKSGYQFTDVSWGSKSNYWKYGSWLPTPSNMFGLRKLMNPNFHADSQVARRPYPTGSSYSSGGMSGAGSGATDGVRLGMGSLPGMGGLAHPTSMKQRFSAAFEATTEQLGAFKFLGESLTGVETPFEAEIELAHASTMTSMHRDYWEREFGSLLGGTELIRRFLMPRNSKARGYNPLPNMMPNWLPGYRSQLSADSRYFLDYHRGDPYTAVPKGEYRMPGPGYEAIYRLHSGIPGVYDAYDRYKILADVAPYSQAFRNYRTIVKAWDKAGILDKYWKADLSQSEAEYEAVRSGYPHYSRRFTKADEGLAAINARAKYGFVERAVGAAWEHMTHDIAPNIPFASKLIKVRSSYEHYLEDEVYGDEYRDWATPFESFIMPQMHKAWSKGPLQAAGLGAILGPLIGATPMSKLAIGAAGAIAATSGSAIHGPGYVPGERKAEWQLAEYMDKIAYVRAKRLQGISIMAGDQQAARSYRKEAARTMVGLPKNASIGQIQAALPGNLKSYFRDMLTMPKGDRQDALQMMPEFTRPAFAQMWNMGSLGEGGTPDVQVHDFFSRNRLPKDNWAGWHPDVSMNLSKMKIVENHAQKLHHHGLWPQERFENPVAYAMMDGPVGVLNDPTPPAYTDNLMREMMNVAALSGDLSEVSSNMVQNYVDLYHEDKSPWERAWASTFGRASHGNIS